MNPRLTDHLSRYHAAGWSVVPLYNVYSLTGDGRNLACSCSMGTDPDHAGTAGKHPIGGQWQRRGLTSWPEIEAAWSRWPAANVGIVTGSPSGFWVLDVDPEHGGADKLRDLITEHDRLPPTYVVQTGSGGWHLYFAMPTDFEPTNSRGRLPVGLDVRGTGGQVVAPPSVSGKGEYAVVDASPVASAPAWLLDLIRPQRERVRDFEQFSSSFSLPLIELSELPEGERGRLARYARSAVAAELGRLADASEGARNETAFAVACNVHELVNAPWSQLDAGSVWAGYDYARFQCGLPATEGAQVWSKAGARIGLRARELPRLPEVGFTPPPLATVGTQALSNGNGHAPAAVAAPSVDPADAVAAMRARVLSSQALDTVEPLEPLIAGFLSLDTCAWIIGQPNHGKSFVALDMALSVAVGRPWHGAAVRPGSALYVAAEGARGVRQRVRAWEARFNGGAPVGNFGIYPEALQVEGPDWATLVTMCSIDRPDIIVFDTQARVSTRFDENSNSEMGRFVEHIEQLRRASGACVVLVHHETKAGGSGRGASAIFGAAQTELTVRRDRDLVTVETTKQKDDQAAPALTLRMVHQVGAPVVGPDGLATPAKGSIVLVDALTGADGTVAHPAQLRAQLAADLQTDSDKILLDVMMEHFSEPGNGWSKADIRREYLARRGGDRRKSSAFYNTFDRLVERGIIGRVGNHEKYRFVSIADREASDLDVMEAADVTDE